MSIAFDTTYDEDQTYEDGKQYAADKSLLVKFEVRAVKNEFQSNLMGRPIYDDVEYIEIIIPGNRDVSKFPMDESYKKRFKERYERWKNSEDKQQQMTGGGTLLAELPWMTKSQIAELAHSHVYTVEQLADLSDTNAMQFMGNNKLRSRAKLFLEAAKGEAPALKLQQELESRDLTIQTLQRQVDDLKDAFAKMEKKNRS